MKRLSIVVPVFKVEPYVEKCLRSLEEQDISRDEYEIICINDGSPDDSRGIIKRLQKEFNNIILFDQENQGVSRARNKGINMATGEYLLCVDPDDYIEFNCFGRILKNIEKHKAQISYLGFTILNENGTIRKQIFNERNSNRIYTGIEASHIARADRRFDPDRIWGVLYNLDFLNSFNLRFLPDVPFAEDAEFITRTLCLAQCCIFDGHSFYQRTNRLGSATNSNLLYTEKATLGLILVANNINKFQQINTLSNSQKEFLNHTICKYVVKTIHSASKSFNFSRISFAKKKLIESGLDIVKLASVYEPYATQGWLYNKSVTLLLIYMFIKGKIHSFKFRINKISNGCV